MLCPANISESLYYLGGCLRCVTCIIYPKFDAGEKRSWIESNLGEISFALCCRRVIGPKLSKF
jgi:hypothetical protein